jgi:hypothetical protein
MATSFMFHLLEPPDFSAPPAPCPRCGANDLWELNLLSDEPIRLCLDCCRERVRKRIETEIAELYRYANLEQLAGGEMDLRLASIRQRLKAIERLTMNYQQARRFKP